MTDERKQKLEKRIKAAVISVRLTASLVSAAVFGFKPPENLTVTQWADKKRRLSPESSAEPGPWRTSRTPYLKEIMDFRPPGRAVVLGRGARPGIIMGVYDERHRNIYGGESVG